MNPDSSNKDLRNGSSGNKTPETKKLKSSTVLEIHQVELNQTFLHYIRHSSPVAIDQYCKEENGYQFNLSAASLKPVHLDGHSALLIQNAETGGQPDRIRVIIIGFKPSVLQEAMKKRYGIHFASIPWIPIIQENSTHHTLLHSLAVWIIQEQVKSIDTDGENWLHVENALLELFIDNLDRRNATRPEEFEIKRTWFTELEQWIAANLNDPIVLDDLALVAGVSVRTIQKAFREYRQCTPMDAVAQQRLVKAREMLVNPGEAMTVLDVAMNLGYLHPSRFASQYKNKYGENPSETLSRCRKNKR